jgi:hypothetical protein
MGISINDRTSGFRKWSEAHDPKITAARAVAGEAAVISALELDQTVTTPEVQPASSVARTGIGHALMRTSIP